MVDTYWKCNRDTISRIHERWKWMKNNAERWRATKHKRHVRRYTMSKPIYMNKYCEFHAELLVLFIRFDSTKKETENAPKSLKS